MSKHGILVLGATGTVGRELVRESTAAGAAVPSERPDQCTMAMDESVRLREAGGSPAFAPTIFRVS